MTDQTLDLDAIEARARAATPGPWFVRPRQYDDWGYIRGPEQSDGPGHFVAQALGGQDYTIDQLNEHRRNKTDPYGHNAAHIAGMDPATTLALTAEVRKLREALAPFAADDTTKARWILSDETRLQIESIPKTYQDEPRTVGEEFTMADVKRARAALKAPQS